MLVLLSSHLLMAEPPRNMVPHQQRGAAGADRAELERLGEMIKAQQLRIEDLRSEVDRLRGDIERLGSAQARQQELTDSLVVDVGRWRSRAEALSSQVDALERRVTQFKGNKKELVGSWKVRSVEEDGAPRPQTVTRLVFSASSVTFRYQEPGRERVYTYKIDPTESPKEIDVFGGGIRPALGIYELQDNQLTLCIDRHFTTRPTEFRSLPESGTALWVLDREGPAPREGPALQAANTPTASGPR